jgi:CheY-like chemotaxis protein
MKSKKRILIVDDNYDVRNILSEFPLIQGFEVETAENGLAALEIFTKKNFDAVLTDFQMPCMDGIKLAHQIRLNDPKTLIMMMTSDINILMGIQEKDLVNHVVEKPFRLNEIYTILQWTLEPKVRNYASSYQ